MRAFLDWWQHIPGAIDPVLLRIGPFQIQYYGLMYLVAFALTYVLVLYRIRREKRFQTISTAHAQGLTTAMIIGVVAGGRLGYVLFYNLPYYLKNPLEIILPFRFSNGFEFTGISGMSYHGGLIGVILGILWYIRRTGFDFWDVVDLYGPAVPLGYTFGRIGNFINGELYGRVTDWKYGMYFPLAPGPDRRHPSQLYEAFFEGIFLFCVLWLIRKKVPVKGAMIGIYLIGYGTVRFFIEFFRQPDAHIGFVLFSLSMGQMLCAGMILIGLALIGWRYVRYQPEST